MRQMAIRYMGLFPKCNKASKSKARESSVSHRCQPITAYQTNTKWLITLHKKTNRSIMYRKLWYNKSESPLCLKTRVATVSLLATKARWSTVWTSRTSSKSWIKNLPINSLQTLCSLILLVKTLLFIIPSNCKLSLTNYLLFIGRLFSSKWLCLSRLFNLRRRYKKERSECTLRLL